MESDFPFLFGTSSFPHKAAHKDADGWDPLAGFKGRHHAKSCCLGDTVGPYRGHPLVPKRKWKSLFAVCNPNLGSRREPSSTKGIGQDGFIRASHCMK